MAAEAMTTLDGDTVDARIPSLFRGVDVMITFCGWPEKAAVGMKRCEGKGLTLSRLTKLLICSQPGKQGIPLPAGEVCGSSPGGQGDKAPGPLRTV